MTNIGNKYHYFSNAYFKKIPSRKQAPAEAWTNFSGALNKYQFDIGDFLETCEHLSNTA